MRDVQSGIRTTTHQQHQQQQQRHSDGGVEVLKRNFDTILDRTGWTTTTTTDFANSLVEQLLSLLQSVCTKTGNCALPPLPHTLIHPLKQHTVKHPVLFQAVKAMELLGQFQDWELLALSHSIGATRKVSPSVVVRRSK